MKTSYISIFILVLFVFAVNSKSSAQQTNDNLKPRSFSEWLKETAWVVGFGGAIVKDNNQNINSSNPLLEFTNYPAQFTADKNLRLNGLSIQLALASTSFRPHTFAELDLNFKYDLNNLIGKTKWFDPYASLGFGLTYRDNMDIAVLRYHDDDLQSTFSTSFGANFWLTKVMGINLQGQAKFAKDPYLAANIGLVFKIRPAVKKLILKPKSQEAKDALQHLRGIINK